MTSVDEPSSAKQKFGKSAMTDTRFENNLFSIDWVPTGYNFAFILQNKYDSSIKIIWDEAAFVDERGSSHKVMHSGVKFIDRNSSQPPTVIVRKGKIEDLVYPTDCVSWREGYYGRYSSSAGGWDKNPILPSLQYGGSMDELRNEANSYVGKIFQVLLPLQVSDATHEYIFKFTVRTANVQIDNSL